MQAEEELLCLPPWVSFTGFKQFIFSLFLSVQSIIMIQTVWRRTETKPPPVELLQEMGLWNWLVVSCTCQDSDI